MKTGIQIIAEERERQVSTEGWTPQHDNLHAGEELAIAAACYAFPSFNRDLKMRTIYRDNTRGLSDPPSDVPVRVHVPVYWPWEPEWWKPVPQDRIRELTKAGALIAAEIDRLQRAKHAPKEGKNT